MNVDRSLTRILKPDVKLKICQNQPITLKCSTRLHVSARVIISMYPMRATLFLDRCSSKRTNVFVVSVEFLANNNINNNNNVCVGYN